MSECRGARALELWARRITAGYPGVRVDNMSAAWRDGLAFCAIIHRFRPDLIDFQSLDPSDVLGNCRLAFETAERELDIPALLEPEDMVQCSQPDKYCVLTYLAQYYNRFATGQGAAAGAKNGFLVKTDDAVGRQQPVVGSGSPPGSISSNGTSIIKDASKTNATQQTKDTNTQPGSNKKNKMSESNRMSGGGGAIFLPRRDNCAVCTHPVFLAEKIVVASKAYHRTCFTCARCGALLAPGSTEDFYETESGQYCCETCPDEELSTAARSNNDTNSEIEDTFDTRSPSSDGQPYHSTMALLPSRDQNSAEKNTQISDDRLSAAYTADDSPCGSGILTINSSTTGGGSLVRARASFFENSLLEIDRRTTRTTTGSRVKGNKRQKDACPIQDDESKIVTIDSGDDPSLVDLVSDSSNPPINIVSDDSAVVEGAPTTDRRAFEIVDSGMSPRDETSDGNVIVVVSDESVTSRDIVEISSTDNDDDDDDDDVPTRLRGKRTELLDLMNAISPIEPVESNRCHRLDSFSNDGDQQQQSSRLLNSSSLVSLDALPAESASSVPDLCDLSTVNRIEVTDSRYGEPELDSGLMNDSVWTSMNEQQDLQSVHATDMEGVANNDANNEIVVPVDVTKSDSIETNVDESRTRKIDRPSVSDIAAQIADSEAQMIPQSSHENEIVTQDARIEVPKRFKSHHRRKDHVRGVLETLHPEGSLSYETINDTDDVARSETTNSSAALYGLVVSSSHQSSDTSVNCDSLPENKPGNDASSLNSNIEPPLLEEARNSSVKIPHHSDSVFDDSATSSSNPTDRVMDVSTSSIDYYPEELNPFGDEEEQELAGEGSSNVAHPLLNAGGGGANEFDTKTLSGTADSTGLDPRSTGTINTCTNRLDTRPTGLDTRSAGSKTGPTGLDTGSTSKNQQLLTPNNNNNNRPNSGGGDNKSTRRLLKSCPRLDSELQQVKRDLHVRRLSSTCRTSAEVEEEDKMKNPFYEDISDDNDESNKNKNDNRRVIPAGNPFWSDDEEPSSGDEDASQEHNHHLLKPVAAPRTTLSAESGCGGRQQQRPEATPRTGSGGHQASPNKRRKSQAPAPPTAPLPSTPLPSGNNENTHPSLASSPQQRQVKPRKNKPAPLPPPSRDEISSSSSSTGKTSHHNDDGDKDAIQLITDTRTKTSGDIITSSGKTSHHNDDGDKDAIHLITDTRTKTSGDDDDDDDDDDEVVVSNDDKVFNTAANLSPSTPSTRAAGDGRATAQDGGSDGDESSGPADSHHGYHHHHHHHHRHSEREWEKRKSNKDENNRSRRSLLAADDRTKPDPPVTTPEIDIRRRSSGVGGGPDKSAGGKWKRKKGPAPSLPHNNQLYHGSGGAPPRRAVPPLALPDIKRELELIEVQQQGLERQGIKLEQMIRDRCEHGQSTDNVTGDDTNNILTTTNDTSSTTQDQDVDETTRLLPPEVEDWVLQLFELVNEKNELFRKQAQLMYMRRQQRLEEEHAELEYQIRCLMAQPELNKTDSDKAHEEQLIARLLEVVSKRNEVVDCQEMDRVRAVEEDYSISTSLESYTAKRDEQHHKSSSCATLPTGGGSSSSAASTPVKLSKKERKKEKEQRKLKRSNRKKAASTTLLSSSSLLSGSKILSGSSSSNAARCPDDVDKDIDESELMSRTSSSGGASVKTGKDKKKKKWFL